LGHAGQAHGDIHGGLLCCLDVEVSGSVLFGQKTYKNIAAGWKANTRFSGRVIVIFAAQVFIDDYIKYAYFKLNHKPLQNLEHGRH